MRVSLVLLAAVFASTARAQQPAPPAADSDYAPSDVMIPMRDGVRLHTVIVTPKNATAPLPILMERTPYGTEGFAGREQRHLRHDRLAREERAEQQRPRGDLRDLVSRLAHRGRGDRRASRAQGDQPPGADGRRLNGG